VQQLVGPVSAAFEYNISADRAAEEPNQITANTFIGFRVFPSRLLDFFLNFFFIGACGTYSYFAVGQLVSLRQPDPPRRPCPCHAENIIKVFDIYIWPTMNECPFPV